MAVYEKPHLSFEKQVEKLTHRGLSCGDPVAAAAWLREIGYYRLSAYTYPLRRLLLPHEPRETEVQFRADEFVPGAELSVALQLYRFDQALRLKVMEGLRALEIALRVQVAYVLGRRSPIGHTSPAFLDTDACDARAPEQYRPSCRDMFDVWNQGYRRLIQRAKAEDYVHHYLVKYEGEIPIWVAVETLDFGALVRLFSLLDRRDQNEVARQFGVSDGRRLHKWFTSLGIVRNQCAHHSRLWNRLFPHAVGAIPRGIASADLNHLEAVTSRRKLYPLAAILAYLLGSYDSASNWHRTFATQMTKFPQNQNLSPENDMGFPLGWKNELLWTRTPTASRNMGR